MIRIKFSKEYNSKRGVSKIYFSNVILNEKQYKENREDKNNKTMIEVKL